MSNKDYLLGKEYNVTLMGATVPALLANTVSLDARMDFVEVAEMMDKAHKGVQFKIVEIIPVTKNQIDWSHVHEDFVALVVKPRPYGDTAFLIDNKNCRCIKAEMFSSFVRGNSNEPVYRPDYKQGKRTLWNT